MWLILIVHFSFSVHFWNTRNNQTSTIVWSAYGFWTMQHDIQCKMCNINLRQKNGKYSVWSVKSMRTGFLHENVVCVCESVWPFSCVDKFWMKRDIMMEAFWMAINIVVMPTKPKHQPFSNKRTNGNLKMVLNLNINWSVNISYMNVCIIYTFFSVAIHCHLEVRRIFNLNDHCNKWIWVVCFVCAKMN